MTGHSGGLTVAIGPDGSESALRFATDHARRAGLDLHLMHVVYLPGGDSYPPPYESAVASARSMLDRAVAQAAQWASEVTVTTELIEEGTAVSMLVTRSATSQALVLEHRRLPRLRRFFTGSIVNGVASRAVVPVVSVPQDWRLAAASPPVVTVAVQDVEEARELIDVASVLARARGAELVVLHAWWMDNGYDTVLEHDPQVRARVDRMAARLQAVLDAVDLGGLTARISVRHEPPMDALIDASVDTDLMVVGRRHHVLPLGTHLGPVARGAVGHARCPVVLAPESRRGHHR